MDSCVVPRSFYKIRQLRPSKSKRAPKIAYTLLDIFCAPSVLSSDMETSSTLLLLKMVHGKAIHSQNQVPLEHAKRDIEHINKEINKEIIDFIQ